MIKHKSEKTPPTASEINISLLQGCIWESKVVDLFSRACAQKGSRLVARPLAHFQDLLEGRTGGLLGAVSQQGALVGMAALLSAENWTAARAVGLVTYPDLDGRLAALCGSEPVGVVQSLCVSDAARGQSVGLRLLMAARDWGFQERGALRVLGQIAQDNECGMKKFMKSGFALAATWPYINPDGTVVEKCLMEVRGQTTDVGGQERQ